MSHNDDVFKILYFLLGMSEPFALVPKNVNSPRLSKRAEKITKEEIKAVILNADDEALSIRNLMAKQESNVIIGDPREYQIELFERAKKQDIIAVLDTGTPCL